MSDNNDKLVRATDIVQMVDGDFGERVVNSVGETIGEVVGESETQCPCVYRTLRGTNISCSFRRGHAGPCKNQNVLMPAWTRCDDGDCKLQFEHLGKHRNENGDEWGKLSIVDIPRAPEGTFLTPQQIQDFAATRQPIDYTRKQPLTPKRPWVMSTGSRIQPRERLTITQTTQGYFRAKDMQCFVDGGPVYIHTILVGQRLQLLGVGGGENGTRADFFKERTTVDFDTLQPAQNFAIIVENRSDAVANFDVSLFGEIVI